MRIAFLTNEFVSEPNSFDGGLSNYVYKICLSLIEYGHVPIVIVISNENKIIKFSNIEVHRVKPKHNLIYKIIDKLTRFKYLYQLNIVNNSYYLNKKLKELKV